MSFLLPIGLFALLVLPVIVLLHIIRERRRRVVVPSLLNWRNLPRPKEGRRLNRLPLTLLLLLQLLVAGLLALAIARPQLIGARIGRAAQTVVLLDTSTSMAARNGASTRFEQARQQVSIMVRNLGSGDSMTLIAANRTPRVIAVGGRGDGAALEAALNQLRPGGTTPDLDAALALAESSLDASKPGQILVLTDGSTKRPADRTTVAPVQWQQFGSSEDNRAIVAFAARPAGGKTQIYARVANYGNASFDGVLRLFADEQPLDARPLQIAGNAEAEQTWTLPTGNKQLRLTLDGNDVLPADDAALLQLETTRPINVVLVSSAPDALRRALAVVPGAKVSVFAPEGYSPTAQAADVTVFDDWLPQAWPDGAVLAIHPPLETTLLTIKGGEEVSGSELIGKGSLVAGLGFGGVNFGAARQVTPTEGMTTLLAAGDAPLVLRGRLDAHELAIWAFDLRESNLSTRLAFPLLVSRTLRDLGPAPLPAELQAGATLALRTDSRTTVVEIVAPDGTVGQFNGGAATIDTFTQPGWYDLIERGASGERFRGRIAVNAGTPLESNLRQEQPPALASAPMALGQAARQVADLWPWLALLAFLALALEWSYVHVQR